MDQAEPNTAEKKAMNIDMLPLNQYQTYILEVIKLLHCLQQLSRVWMLKP